MKILCVAEKPSIAKSISEILAGNGGFQSRPGKDKFCRNFDLQYNWGGRDGWVEMTITSVRGHLTENDFGERYRTWGSCDPLALFEAPVETKLSKDGEGIANNLRQEARRATILMIWTDCDREGEHIGAEVVRECRKANPRIQVKRARFSAIIANQIHAACRDAGELDWAAASAVEARQELDLRVGAALTRLQTTNLQNALPELGRRVMSYGPCQFPTLGFVVDQYEKVRNFISEPFWHISVTHKRREAAGLPLQTVTFAWKRGHLFDKPTVELLYDSCRNSMEALVTKVTSKPTRKFKPYPLTTVELQKSGSRLLRMAPKKILDLAEALYNKGFLSYPRTETDQYDGQFDFLSLIRKQISDNEWGTHAQHLLDHEADAYERPRNGRKNDKAHPPIHPTAHANNLSADEKKVYEYVTRRFLASCSRDATGKQTNVEIEVAGELFGAGGLVIHERNYLDVFPYDKWGDSLLPPFHEGERFKPTSCVIKEGSTSAPNLLTEADLVNLMDKNGIGTDATIAEHISKVIAREYVEARQVGQTTYLMPSTLGMGLVDGYNGIDFEKSLCKPLLRRETEYRMTLICEGQRTKDQTLEESIAEYRAMYLQTKQNLGQLIDSVRRFITGEHEATADVAPRRAHRRSNEDAPRDQHSDDDDDDDDQDGHQVGAGSRSRAGPSRTGQQRVERRIPSNVMTARTVPPRSAGALQSTPSSYSVTVRPPLINVQDNGQAPQCRCGRAAVQRTVVSQGGNQGKRYWNCEKGQSDGCGFFSWVLDDQGSIAGSSTANNIHGVSVRDLGLRERRVSSSGGASTLATTNTINGGRSAVGRIPQRSLSPEVAMTRQRSPPRRIAGLNGSAPVSNGNAHRDTTSSGPPSAPLPLPPSPPQPPMAAPSREEIEARNEGIAILDELAAMSSQGGDEDFQSTSDHRIDEYRAWFANMAAGGGGGGGGDTGGRAGGAGSSSSSSSYSILAHPKRKRCDCGLEASLKTVLKEGINKGKKFYCCPKENATVRCRFFLLLEEEDDDVGQDEEYDGAGRQGDTASGSGWTVESLRERIRAGQPTTTTTTPTSASYRTGQNGMGATIGSCYKCSREGHWAKDCPGEAQVVSSSRGGGAGGAGGAGAGGSTRGATTGQCFKCGEEGHWSSECPNEGPVTTSGRSITFPSTFSRGRGGSSRARGSGRGHGARGGARGGGGGGGGRMVVGAGKKRTSSSTNAQGGSTRKRRR